MRYSDLMKAVPIGPGNSAVALSLVGLIVIAAPLPAQTVPTFARDIAPIIYNTCAQCHHAGGSGPFPLTSYEDVRAHARQIAAVTRSRFMPPWLPEHRSARESFGEFVGELRLTSAQIEVISQWVEQGMPPGDLSSAPQPPVIVTGWALGQPDLIVKAPEPLKVPASGPDIFWNFVLSPHVSTSRYVRAIEIRPQNAKLIHHANIVVDRMGTITRAFPGMDVTVPRNPLDLDGHFLFFKPGSTASVEPDGFSWRIDPATTLILNTHIQTSGKEEEEQPLVALYFTDKPPTHFPYLLELERDDALDIPAGAPDFLVRDDFKLPIDTEVLAIYPHAHYLGRVLEAYATLPDGTRKWLIHIPHWNPDWQAVYRYRNPVKLPAGTIISMRYHYDNSKSNLRNPNVPPKRVQGGNQATDEMAHLWLQVMPSSRHDSRRIYAEAWAKHELERNPNSYAANLTLGSLALARFDALSAVAPLRKAIAENSKDAFAHNLYGSALAGAGRNTEAALEFETALQLRPDLANARFNLAHCLASAGKQDEAIQNLRQILKDYPNDPTAKSYLQELLSSR